MADPATFSVRDLATRWGVSDRTIYRLHARDELPGGFAVGSQIRFLASAILAYERIAGGAAIEETLTSDFRLLASHVGVEVASSIAGITADQGRAWLADLQAEAQQPTAAATPVAAGNVADGRVIRAVPQQPNIQGIPDDSTD